MIKNILIIFLIISTSWSQSQIHRRPITVDELMIEVSGISREIAYTNKQAGYFYTETNGEHRTAWEGWHIMSMKMMDDYSITIDGETLRKNDVQFANVFPHQLKRMYNNGAYETVTMLDAVDAIVVELEHINGTMLNVAPLFSESHLRDDYVVKWEGNVLLIAKKRHLQRTAKENYPVWIGITEMPSSVDMNPQFDSLSIPFFSPAQLSIKKSGAQSTIVFVAGDSVSQTIALAKNIAANYFRLILQRRDRMEHLLNRSYIRTDNQRFTKAINWAKISMDALIMNQLKRGIFAGLPWFDNYWGRDSYISLPGATLVTGNFSDAKQILRSFAGWQDKNENHSTFGRIPNLVTTSSISYNTADGTPWFTIAVGDYIRYSNDTSFGREMYPAIRLAIEGAMNKRVDKNGFLTHADAETWMDAVGTEGAWSPRGNRANDIQALWYRQLRVGAELAAFVGDAESASKWNKHADTLRSNFNTYFVNADSGLVYDHLNVDDSRDTQVRPNQLFTMDIVNDPDIRAKIFKNVTQRLVYRHGVASLWQEDPNFHPYHHFEPAYVQDAAYHNGIVWTWLAGRWIDAAAGYGLPNLAYNVTDYMIHQILDSGSVGTISELIDAAPRSGETEPRRSGTFSQAWSLAEFIRVWYQSYLGITVDARAHQLILHPQFSLTITDAECSIPMSSYVIQLHYHLVNGEGKITLQSSSASPDLDIEYERVTDNGITQKFVSKLPAGKIITLAVTREGVVKKTSINSYRIKPVVQMQTVPLSILNGLHLAMPVVHPDLSALKGPNHRMLSNSEIKASNARATVLFDMPDPEGDANGTGSYMYPFTSNLKPGSLDITNFNVTADENNIYFSLQFRNLSNPGWHPEYGFQLTFGAITIDKDGVAGSGQVFVGRNANYRLEASEAYENIIYFGGGISIEDATGKILAEYQPVSGDEKNPLGRTETGIISFAIPVNVLGKPLNTWKYTVLIGAQDDHGGAGIGEFRTVAAESGEWVGGGKQNPGDPNVYDVITAKKQKWK